MKNEKNLDKTVKASPTKDFFISMLIKDIGLTRAIIDLIDNSIDGAKRIRPNADYKNLFIKVSLSKENFEIKDNCGGIPIKIAQEYAFRFGRPETMEAIPHSVGQFGVGMKRAIFKLGKQFSVISQTEEDFFKIEEDIEKWKLKTEWTFDFSELKTGLQNVNPKKIGTTISVTKLHNSVSDDFGLDTFITRLSNEIRAAQSDNLEGGITIILNQKELVPYKRLLYQSDNLKPSFKEISIESDKKTVGIRIYVGVYEPNPEEAGWYIYCNGRLILGADQTNISGWGENRGNTIPKYHNDYSSFRGYIFFDAEDASLLPWNTTKTGVDVDSPLFRSIRQEMINQMKPVLDFLRKLRNEKSNDDLDERPLEFSLQESKPINLFKIDRQSIFYYPDAKKIKKVDTKVIQYRKPLEQINKVQENLEVNSYKEVGEKTFEYFYKREIEN